MAAAGERLAMPLEDWIQHSIVARFLYDWQTLAAGLFALLAAVGTILATRSTASRQINASREEADRVIAATRAQTEATSSKPKRPFVWRICAMQAKPAHFASCSKRRWRASSPRRLGPEGPIRTF